ncbi:hypothetical protein SADUNF_Sadunf13G0070200 [Salix dunnii]|uniref:Uroporphyrinogen decarboxylase (URO-D) domain-containing protein n=1 Tax=Salix dunnii TaxID=1413687 RepID=A0A835JNX2_9ROSI|nr:hypothetical protein SADUNF_Sadunf13G0070200 [Salix dunnii]
MLLELGVERPPVWLGLAYEARSMEIRKCCEKHPSFLERSENVDLVVEVTRQPWNVFRPDGVIFFSTFWDFVEGKSPVIFNPLRTADDVDLAGEFVLGGSIYYHEKGGRM